MQVDADGSVAATLPGFGRAIFDLRLRVGSGERTRSEAPGHREIILTYESFAPLGAACLPR